MQHLHASPPFDLEIAITFNSVVCKNRFSKFCIKFTKVMMSISATMHTKPRIDAQEGAILAQVGHFQILLQCRIFHSEKNAMFLSVRQTKRGIIRESSWIILKEVASKLALDDAESHLVCASAESKEECNHGQYFMETMFHSYSLESAQAKKNCRHKIKCPNSVGLEKCLPTQMAIDIQKHLYAQDDLSLMSYTSKPLTHENLEKLNLLSVIFKETLLENKNGDREIEIFDR